jgi:DNA-binding response OmpR family regulator
MSKRALVVDDDHGNRMTLSALLTDVGYEVDEAESFCSGEGFARRTSYTVAVLDLDLGDGLGSDLARILRAESPSTRIVLLSGSDHVGRTAPALDAVLPKGIAFEALLAAMESGA